MKKTTLIILFITFGFLAVGQGCVKTNKTKTNSNKQKTKQTEVTDNEFANSFVKKLVEGNKLYIPYKFKGNYVTPVFYSDSAKNVNLDKNDFYSIDLKEHNLPIKNITSIAISKDKSKIAYSTSVESKDFVIYNLKKKNKIRKNYSDYKGFNNYVKNFTNQGKFFKTASKSPQGGGPFSCIISSDNKEISVCHKSSQPPIFYKNKYIIFINNCTNYNGGPGTECKNLTIKNINTSNTKKIEPQKRDNFKLISPTKIKGVDNTQLLVKVKKYKNKDTVNPPTSTMKINLSKEQLP